MEIRRGPSKAVVIVSVLFVLALIIAIATLGYFWYQKANPKTDKAATPGSNSISLDGDSEKVKTETITTALVIPKSTDKVGDTIKLSVLGITVPTSWRTINGKNLLNTPLQSIYATSVNDILAQLIMVPERDPADTMLATNNLSLYNVTSWQAQSSQGEKAIVTPAMKQKYIANIANMGAGGGMDKSACDGGSGVFNMTLCDDLLKPTVVATADGSLKGVAYLSTTLAQEPGYDPQVIVFMTGQAKDQQLMAYGAFHLLDKNAHTLSASDSEGLKAAWEAYKKGDIPSDTMTLYQHVIDAVKSMKIQVN